eukprot:2658249-Amphidinium_carterae.3
MASNERFRSLLEPQGQWVVLDFATGVIIRLPEALRYVHERPIIAREGESAFVCHAGIKQSLQDLLTDFVVEDAGEYFLLSQGGDGAYASAMREHASKSLVLHHDTFHGAIKMYVFKRQQFPSGGQILVSIPDIVEALAFDDKAKRSNLCTMSFLGGRHSETACCCTRVIFVWRNRRSKPMRRNSW